MKEVKSPKKPLIYYYAIALLAVLVFNLFVGPMLMRSQVNEVDYGTFMKMTEEKQIGKVEVEDSQILFTDKDEKTIYSTTPMEDPALTERLYDSGAVFTKEIQKTTSPLLTYLLPIVIFFCAGAVYEQKAHAADGRQKLDDVRHGQIERQGICAVYPGHPLQRCGRGGRGKGKPCRDRGLSA